MGIVDRATYRIQMRRERRAEASAAASSQGSVQINRTEGTEASVIDIIHPYPVNSRASAKSAGIDWSTEYQPITPDPSEIPTYDHSKLVNAARGYLIAHIERSYKHVDHWTKHANDMWVSEEMGEVPGRTPLKYVEAQYDQHLDAFARPFINAFDNHPSVRPHKVEATVQMEAMKRAFSYCPSTLDLNTAYLIHVVGKQITPSIVESRKEEHTELLSELEEGYKFTQSDAGLQAWHDEKLALSLFDYYTANIPSNAKSATSGSTSR